MFFRMWEFCQLITFLLFVLHNRFQIVYSKFKPRVQYGRGAGVNEETELETTFAEVGLAIIV